MVDTVWSEPVSVGFSRLTGKIQGNLLILRQISETSLRNHRESVPLRRNSLKKINRVISIPNRDIKIDNREFTCAIGERAFPSLTLWSTPHRLKKFSSDNAAFVVVQNSEFRQAIALKVRCRNLGRCHDVGNTRASSNRDYGRRGA